MSRLSWWICFCIGVLLGIAVASHCSHAQSLTRTHDRWGYELPVECRKDLSFVPTIIYYHQDLGYVNGQKQLARWNGSDSPWGIIRIDRTVSKELMPEVVAHERCHALFNYMYGTPFWHME